MIHRFECIDSTNTYLKQLADSGAPEGTAVVATMQTGGRGRLGRSFHSPTGGLYLSYLLRPDYLPEELMHLTCAAAVAACDAVEAVCQLRPGIKWTNDLVIGKRKLGGILTELGFSGDRLSYAIIGIGINCTQGSQDFPAEIADIATSLAIETNNSNCRDSLESALVAAFDKLARNLLTNKEIYLSQYRASCVTMGKEILVVRGDDRYYATALDIDDAGGLIIRTSDNTLHTVTSGEVSIRGMYGYL